MCNLLAYSDSNVIKRNFEARLKQNHEISQLYTMIDRKKKHNMFLYLLHETGMFDVASCQSRNMAAKVRSYPESRMTIL